MTLASLLPQAKFVIVTTPQPTAQKVARRSAQMADKVKLEIAGVIENMSGFTTPGGERFQLFGEGGGQLLADEIDVPLLGKVPLTMPLREGADSGIPLLVTDPDDPAAQAIRQAARGHHRDVADRAAGAPGARAGRGAAAGRDEPADGVRLSGRRRGWAHPTASSTPSPPKRSRTCMRAASCAASRAAPRCSTSARSPTG